MDDGLGAVEDFADVVEVGEDGLDTIAIALQSS